MQAQAETDHRQHGQQNQPDWGEEGAAAASDGGRAHGRGVPVCRVECIDTPMVTTWQPSGETCASSQFPAGLATPRRFDAPMLLWDGAVAPGSTVFTLWNL